MAKTREQTWEPTADGQAVLYGVPGPSYDTEKFSKGYTVLFDELRPEIADCYDRRCKVREQRVSQTDAWNVRFYPSDARGTWDADGDETVLRMDGKEIARGVIIDGRVRKPQVTQAFNPAKAAEVV